MNGMDGTSEMPALTPIVDALSAALSDYWAFTPEVETSLAGEVIAILATPEMQAMRQAFRKGWGSDISPASLGRNLRQIGLPESVVGWITS